MKTRFNKELDALIADLQRYRADDSITPEKLAMYVRDSIDLFDLYKDEPDCNSDGLCYECEKIAAWGDEFLAE